MSTTVSAAAPPHVLVIPYPGQGHILALLDLTHQLCLRGLSATVVVTPKSLPALRRLLAAHPSSAAALVLPFPAHPRLPPGAETTRDTGNSGNYPISAALSRLDGPILDWFRSQRRPPAAIVSDFFLGWTVELARRVGVPRIAFFSVSTLLPLVLDRCWRDLEAVRAAPVVEFLDLPGAPSFRAEELPSIFRLYRESDPDSEVVRSGMIANMESWGFIFNSFHGLEGRFLDHFVTKMGYGRVFGVGPLSLIGVDSAAGPGISGSGRGEAVVDWLDGCPDGSVLYVCFGSQKMLTGNQIEALGSGLDRSGARFVWVVNESATIPNGYEERVAGRGVVIRGWAPQVQIMNHRAVGWFLSHCGWNSVQEAITSGVVVLGWPMEADQFVNARMLVDDMGAAVRVCEGADTVPDPDKLGRAISETIGRGGPQKLKAKELRDKAFAAVRSDGTSSRDLDKLVKELGLLQVNSGLNNSNIVH